MKSETMGLVAWAGWEWEVPADWLPLKVSGTEERGELMLGDATRPIVLVKWWRPEGDGSFAAAECFAQRLRQLGTGAASGAPRPPGVEHAAWARGFAVKGGGSKSVWYGYAPASRLVLELVMTSLTEEALQGQVFMRLLPRLRLTAAGAPRYWCLLSTGFTSPAGFALSRQHLFSGDTALEFTHGATETVVLRQVYPASLALARRSPERWLAVRPFEDRRRFRPLTWEPWSCGTPRALTGWQQRGWRRFPVPLGRLRPRFSTTLITSDPQLDRLLIAEHLSPADCGPELPASLLTAMNRHLRSGGL